MKPKIIEFGAFKVAGLQTYGGAMSSNFAKMWSLLMDGDLEILAHLSSFLHISPRIVS